MLPVPETSTAKRTSDAPDTLDPDTVSDHTNQGPESMPELD
jgi:hypothetical protein